MPNLSENLSEAILNEDLSRIDEILKDPENSSLLKIKTDDITPVVMAATSEKWASVRAIAQVPTDFSDEADYGVALLLAAKANETDTVLALLAANTMNTHLQLATDEYKGYTALHFAVKHNNLELVESLRLGEAVSLINEAHESPILLAAKEGNWPIVVALSEIPPSKKLVRHYEYAFLLAAHANATVACLALLQSITTTSHQIASGPYEGYTALHFAIENDNLLLIHCLRLGRALTVKNKSGESPVLFAAKQDKWAFVEALTEVPMEDAVQSDYEHALLLAAQAGETAALKSLIQAGTPADAQYTSDLFKGFTALHFAVTSDVPEMVEFLVQAKPLLMSMRDEEGNSPILLAARAEKWSIVADLVARTENRKDVDFEAVRDLARVANQFEMMELIDAYFLKIKTEEQEKIQFAEQGNIICLNLDLLKTLGLNPDDQEITEKGLDCPISFDLYRYPVSAQIHEQDAMPIYELKDIQDHLKNESSDPSGYGELTGHLIPHLNKQSEVIQFLKEQWQALLSSDMNDDGSDEKKMTLHIIREEMAKDDASFEVFGRLDALEDITQAIHSAKEAKRFEQFKQAYFEKYNGTFFKNPFSTMRQKLMSHQITSMKDVTDYVKDAPKSRTAKILTQMNLSDMTP